MAKYAEQFSEVRSSFDIRINEKYMNCLSKSNSCTLKFMIILESAVKRVFSWLIYFNGINRVRSSKLALELSLLYFMMRILWYL